MKKIIIFLSFITILLLISGCVEFPEKQSTSANQDSISKELPEQQQETIYSMNQNVNVDYNNYDSNSPYAYST